MHTVKCPEFSLAPVIGKITHHSVELSWVNEENKAQKGSPEHWTRFYVEQMDPKTHTFSTVYRGYSCRHVVEGLKSRSSYTFRLKVTSPSGESFLSPAVTVVTTRQPYTGKELHQAVNRQDEQELIAVLSSGMVDVDVCDKMGFTPLMVAAQKGFSRFVEILVKHGADLNKRDSTGRDCLMQACYAGHLDTVKCLRDYGCSWESRDTDGCTPLHWAVDVLDTVCLWTPLMRTSVVSGNTAVATVLLQAGAEVNIRDRAGKTPLMVAVLNDHTDLVKLLLENGADHNMKNEVTYDNPQGIA
ncbi:hypothetical protein DNTS_031865 [Danionella cerebrum]|uniref:Fibronectin type-III domain-containing protein n=1 Tax=Danionella cerebrum TaxID=2873325 RepID=A0A553RGN3_9TELE|nr:hypothetical protein DNTS_031865 [Danionella translucida]